ncbi:MAG: peptidase S41, partial [Muribaculaceae bacterium]|nr:peptidase S41 [Muribaculaceae bacterium]
MKQIRTIFALALTLLYIPALSAQTSGFTPEMKLRMANRIMETYYVDSIDSDKAVESAIVAMLKTLDPHSTYTNAEETRELNTPLE